MTNVLPEKRDPETDSAVIAVNQLRYHLIGAFQTVFVMESRHIARIAEQVAAELYRLGVDPPKQHSDQTLFEDFLAVAQEAARNCRDLYPDEPPEDMLVKRVRYFADLLAERGYRKTG